jgi:hypothetical protein
MTICRPLHSNSETDIASHKVNSSKTRLPVAPVAPARSARPDRTLTHSDRSGVQGVNDTVTGSLVGAGQRYWRCSAIVERCSLRAS